MLFLLLTMSVSFKIMFLGHILERLSVGLLYYCKHYFNKELKVLLWTFTHSRKIFLRKSSLEPGTLGKHSLISWYSQIYSVVEGRCYIKFSQVFISVKFHCIAKGLTSILARYWCIDSGPMLISSACLYSINYGLKILGNAIFIKCTQYFCCQK